MTSVVTGWMARGDSHQLGSRGERGNVPAHVISGPLAIGVANRVVNLVVRYGRLREINFAIAVAIQSGSGSAASGARCGHGRSNIGAVSHLQDCVDIGGHS